MGMWLGRGRLDGYVVTRSETRWVVLRGTPGGYVVRERRTRWVCS